MVSEKTASAGKALVLGWDPRSFLAAIRSLGRRGVEVHVGWCPEDSWVLRSRYVRRFHDLPPWHTKLWLEPLAELMRRERFDLVLPCHDETLIPLHAHRAELEPLGRIALPGDRGFEVAMDKWKTMQLARELKIAIPDGELVANADAALAAAEKLGWPVVVKPPRSVDPLNLWRRFSVRKAYHKYELEHVLDSMLKHGPVVIQRNEPGYGAGIEFLADRGRLLCAFQHRRMHEPLHGGGGSYRRSEPPHPELLDAAAKLVAATEYHGLGMIEFKINPASGAWTLMEINPRLWGSLPLAISAGADFPWFLYEMMVRGRTEFPTDYRRNLYQRNLRYDLPWILADFTTKHGDPTLATVPRRRVLAEFGNIPLLCERWDEITLDDPLPAFAAVGGIFMKAMRLMALKTQLAWLGIPANRERHAGRARAAVAGARRISFVCLGNICRSPYAEHYARMVLPASIEIDSRGTFPVPDRACPATGIEVAAGAEIDLVPHRSRLLTEQGVARADAIFIFDERNYRTIARDFPASRGKLFYLGALDPEGPVVLSDPFGGDRETFEAAYARIRRAIDALRPG